MFKWVIPRLFREEGGQTTIFVAIVGLFVLVPMMGLAVEGGRVFTTYRQMQAAADMAALVGAQDLPSASTAAQDACTYAQKNGFGGGWNSGTSNCWAGTNSTQATVCVPPQSKSPYEWLAYGGGNCGTPASSRFIEVQIQKDLGTVPIFHVPVTLWAHAVARRGIPGLTDYAIIVLNPTTASNSNNLKFAQNANAQIWVAGSIQSNNSNATKSIEGPAGTQCSAPPASCTAGEVLVCSGSIFANSAENPLPNNNFTYDNPTYLPLFSPPGCQDPASGTSSQDTLAPDPVIYQNRAGSIPDPYASTPVPSASGMASNCPQCGTYGWYYQGWTSTAGRPNGTWTQTSASDNQPVHVTGKNSTFEFYPGVYPQGISLSGGSSYFNPGVYTIGGSGVTITGSATLCIYGSPACDQASNTANPCSTATFNTSTASAQWYYMCSPWGFYDTVQKTGTSGGTPPSSLFTAPVFLNQASDGTTSAVGTPKLNGVTFYLQGQTKSGNDFSMTGSGNATLAFPNPCPGTGAYSSSLSTVAYPAGSASGVYAYSSGSVPSLDLTAPATSSAGAVYPSADLSSSGECNLPYVEWPNEFDINPKQHLHFLIFSQADPSLSCSAITLAGSGTELFDGILHTYPESATAAAGGTPNSTTVGTTAYTGCSISAGGSSGAAGGPPFLLGQVIADDVTFSGNATVQVFDRPGGRATGPGTSLVQ
jgi:Putative Flp pilus-assembly TadE/G-like